jgi:hypothetical protein
LITSPTQLSTLSLNFWYSVPDVDNGNVRFFCGNLVELDNSPSSILKFLPKNPGVSMGGLGDGSDSHFFASASDLGAGRYRISLSTAGHVLDGFKAADSTVPTVEVAEAHSM